MLTDSARFAEKTRPVSIIETSQLMLCREIFGVCCESCYTDPNTVWAERVFIRVKGGST